MPGMPDKQDGVPARGEPASFRVDLLNQRTGGVDHRQAAIAGLFPDSGGDSVRGEDHSRPGWNLIELLDKDRTATSKISYHVAVVDDLLTHVDRRPVHLQCPLDHLDRPFDAGTERPGLGKQHLT